MARHTDDGFIVDIPDGSIELGHDPDGLPRTDPVKKGPSSAKPKPDAVVDLAPKKSAADDDDAEAKRIARLQREHDASRREAEANRLRAEAAEAVARDAIVARSKAEDTAGVRTEQAIRAHYTRVAAEHDSIVGAIGSTKNQVESAKREYQMAREAGDAARETEAMDALSEARAALAQLDAGRIAAKEQVEHAKGVYEQFAAERNTTPVRKEPEAPKRLPSPDEWIDATRPHVGEDGADWLRTHKEYVTDPKLNRKFLRFSDDYADDHGPDALKSREFVEELNRRFATDDDEPEQPRRQRSRVRSDDDEDRPAPRSRAASSAPVARGNQFFSSRNPNATQVKLPPALAQFVKESGMDPVKYALGAVEDIKAGRLPKNFLDPDYQH